MLTVGGHRTIAAYCQEMLRKDITVNKDYQRSNQVWPPAARSYLVETVLLSYPVPKLSLFQKTDIKSRRTIFEIVDGQQRSVALLDFYQDKFALAKSIETPTWRGLTFSQLEESDQIRFLEYSLSIDVFTSASDEEVREVFRRMNSYTVPLNAEEQRHAKWQGSYKWFINSLTRQYNQVFATIGLFANKGLVRMQDTKLLTEICRAFLYGIETTKATQLDAVYRDLDNDFPQKNDFEQRLTTSLDQLNMWADIHNTSLMKPHIAYSLLLALIHVHKEVPTLQNLFNSKRHRTVKSDVVLPRLTALSEALDMSEEEQANLPDNLREFIAASSGGNNVKENRVTRFVWFCNALTEKSN